MAQPLIAAEESEGALRLRLAGRWTIGSAAELDRRLGEIERSKAPRVAFDLRALEAIDTAGAWLLLRTRERLAGRGANVAIENLASEFEPLLRQVADARPEPYVPPLKPRNP